MSGGPGAGAAAAGPAGALRVVGYGSLMSRRGLGPLLPGVRAARPVQLGATRWFAKPARAGAVLAMDIRPSHGATLRARRLAAPPDGPPAPLAGGAAVAPGAPTAPALAPALARGPWCEALLLELDVAAAPDLAMREGLPPDGWVRLARAAGGPVAPWLLALARAAGDDVLAYRRALRAAAGPLDRDGTVHYLPHPVALEDDPGAGPALVFVAPDPGETGGPEGSSKAPFPALRPCRLDRLFGHGPAALGPRFDPAGQRDYVDKCLAGRDDFGLDLGDLAGDRLEAE